MSVTVRSSIVCVSHKKLSVAIVDLAAGFVTGAVVAGLI
jgi:hypothetical protein